MKWHLKFFPVDSVSDVGSYEGNPPRVGDTLVYRQADGLRRKVVVGEVVTEAEEGLSKTYVYIETPAQEEARKNARQNAEFQRLREQIQQAKEAGTPFKLPNRLRGRPLPEDIRQSLRS